MEIRQEPAILNFGNINNLTGEVWRSGNDIAFVTDLSAIFSKSFRLPNDLSLTCFLRRGTLLAEVNGIRCICYSGGNTFSQVIGYSVESIDIRRY